jgi:diamine N-acetyltransferase
VSPDAPALGLLGGTIRRMSQGPEPGSLDASPSAAQEGVDLVLVGERAALGPLRTELADRYARWLNEPETKLTYGGPGVASPEAMARTTAEWIDRSAADPPEEVHFTIYDRRDMRPVGMSKLFSIGRRAGTAYFGILIGERRGDGLGTEATRLTLDYGFTILDLYNVMLFVVPWNRAALTVYENVGFREVGRRRGAVLARGRRHDLLMFDLIAGEFESPRLAAIAERMLEGHAR